MCGQPRKEKIERCPSCGDHCASFTINIPYRKWLRKHGKAYRIIVTGPRSFKNEMLIFQKLDKIFKKLLEKRDLILVTGEERPGVAKKWAEKRWLTVEKAKSFLDHVKLVVAFFDGEDEEVEEVIEEVKHSDVKLRIVRI